MTLATDLALSSLHKPNEFVPAIDIDKARTAAIESAKSEIRIETIKRFRVLKRGLGDVKDSLEPLKSLPPRVESLESDVGEIKADVKEILARLSPVETGLEGAKEAVEFAKNANLIVRGLHKVGSFLDKHWGKIVSMLIFIGGARWAAAIAAFVGGPQLQHWMQNIVERWMHRL